jgi:hypothetical protein
MHTETDADLCDSFRRALREAEEQLSAKDEMFRRLEAERNQLREIVVSLSAYLKIHSSEGQVENRPLNQVPIIATNTPQKGARAWEQAQAVLDENKIPMTVPEIYDALQAKGITMAKDAIRIAMLRKPVIFRQVGNASYALISWTAPDTAIWPWDSAVQQPLHEEAS